VLHEIHDTKDRSVLVAGVMDGHGGTAASSMVSNEITNVLSNQFVVNRKDAPDALADSWDIVCKSYQQQCMNEDEECVAEYDPREGILMANNGSEDLIAGTTASIMALDETTGKLTLLNCGDSRSMVVTPEGKVGFVTEDHTPRSEEERLMEGVEAGLQYSLPKCRISKWSISVGDYEYSVGRSLEGPFATSKGLVSAPDVTTLSATPGETLVSASDGLWGVMDSDEVALHLCKMRKEGMPARDAARALCSLALKKGTPDNVSAVVVFL
jgi:serine/threonine protein phosphatase PrpC